MKISFFALLCALFVVPVFAQTAPVNTPNSSAYFGETNAVVNCIPKIAQFLGAYNFYDCSKVSDNGTQPMYNGNPMVYEPPVNVQTGTSYTLAPSDCTFNGVTVAFSNITANTAVILPQPGPNFPAGCKVKIRNLAWSVPDPATGGIGYAVVLTSVGSTIALNQGSTLGSRTSVSLPPLTDCWIQSDGTNWTQPRCHLFLLM